MIYRILGYVLGMLFISMGVVIMIHTEVGAAPWDALNVGLSTQIGLSIGSWIFIVGIIIILLSAILKKKIPNLLNVIPIVIIGTLVDALNNLGWFQYHKDQPILTYLLFFCGLFSLALGISLYLKTKLPFLIPNDELTVILSNKLKVRLGTAKIISEATACLLAFLFGGPIGIGTILTVVFLGLFINLIQSVI